MSTLAATNSGMLLTRVQVKAIRRDERDVVAVGDAVARVVEACEDGGWRERMKGLVGGGETEDLREGIERLMRRSVVGEKGTEAAEMDVE